ncbi:xanthine dehydrogenase accessory protein XdhC [Algicella marina]|uniref:Xanthine dehydrogenase accessory protein XdhC n=1 Tax=Algicella marina TaxID=2683284 RepID=A0A6P1SZ09_9RHOB|nr:xanthine dehydrogenase accessory protein XdhC [Algicella marina]QHQ35708.1 xanthine dehydrogenase accessory protein XdhC [Algicella marina]
MSFDRATLAEFVAANGTAVRIVIMAHKGSTPREVGTSMLVSRAAVDGTIGGGALEHQAISDARTLLADLSRQRRSLRVPLGPALGQCCGGSVELLLERFDANNLPEPDTAFARSVDGSIQPLAITRLLARSRQGEMILPTVAGGWFIEPPSMSLVPVWIWGAGHVGRAIVRALEGLPFDITWIDDDRQRFPDPLPDHVAPLLASNPVDATHRAPADAHHIVLTYSHALDLALTHALLSRPHASVGLIGSATKKARFMKRLSEMGLPSARTATLVCPIGHRALGKEPAAIALGVAFRLLEDVRAGQSVPASKGDVA